MTEPLRRVLVLEDEMLVAMLIEDMLTDLGFEVVGPALRLEPAMTLAREAALDCAVLDINLSDTQSFPVADILTTRGIPFIFATGYGKPELIDTYREAITLKKPFEAHHLQRAVDEVLS